MAGNSWIIVANRYSGKGRAPSRSANLRRILEYNGDLVFEVNETDRDSSLSLLLRAIESRLPDGLLVVGGDGLVNDVVNVLHRAFDQIPMVVVPEGTGNDFARTCATYGLSDEEIVHLIQNREPHQLDLLRINGRVCVEIAATGFDAEVNRRANSFKRVRGKIKYVIAMIQEISRMKPIRYRLSMDGEQSNFEAIFVAVANSSSYGGGMRISPNSRPDDGLVEVAFLHPVGRVELLRVFPRVFSGSHINHPKFRILQGRSGRLEADTSVFADGEDFGKLPVAFEVVAGALKAWRYS